MASSSRDGGRKPFGDITNIEKSDSQEQTQPFEKKELKRQRDRERYANMAPEKKSALLLSRRQSYQANKLKAKAANSQNDRGVQVLHPVQEDGDNVLLQSSSPASNKENLPPQSVENFNLEQIHDNSMGVANGPNLRTLSPG